MSLLALINGRIVSGERLIDEHMMLIENDRIVEIRSDQTPPTGATVLDVQGHIIAPGFIDIHVHGGGGYDTMDATPEALQGIATFVASHGVTSFLPTTIASSQQQVQAAVENVASYQQRHRDVDGAHILGMHLEGPYLNTAYPGAQPPHHIRPADPGEYERLFVQGNISLISLAPEISVNLELVKYAVAHGARVAVGHSAAQYEEVMEAVACGVTQACHIFNGMRGLHHREPGTVGAVLSCDEIYAQVIADLIHVHPAVLKILIRAKGVARTILITDAMRAAGLPDGHYDLGGQEVTVCDGAVHLVHGDSLAGSVLTMDQAVLNVMQTTQLSLPQAVSMATSVPAESLGLGHEIGTLAPGYLADLVVFDAQVHVLATIVHGTLTYRSQDFRA
ncbi:N-acetylglucosamine-6-phosphate deacetylase [Dictyobacter formicarum]|uniref:N-acetylglucosamine-6-phosphate deacetylase n=1 Tax=Dictyobacter formicarum TaxID=2778368 RepID=A0ABQ3VHA3_9CHLR|nr:N-acetylglucosamine-6-phosphate deacetylase [Dictyobacter formicarum]GHO85084.1 N-acetylglucosamine-6-phosphate deacetylase [Dictyobacter formicarum]